MPPVDIDESLRDLSVPTMLQMMQLQILTGPTGALRATNGSSMRVGAGVNSM